MTTQAPKGYPTRPELLSQAEAAIYLKVSADTLRREERAGRIVPVRLTPRKPVYPRAMLDKLLATWSVGRE